jgi:hypothetical protein
MQDVPVRDAAYSGGGNSPQNSGQYDPRHEIQELARRFDALPANHQEELMKALDQLGRQRRIMTTGDRFLDEKIAGEQGAFGLEGYRPQEIGLSNVDDLFRYQPWRPDQNIQGDAVRDALVFAAKVILRSAPRGPSRLRAIEHLIYARMDANAAISFGGRF